MGVAQRSRQYETYMASIEWEERRADALQRARYRCNRCGDLAEQVHHRTYERLGREHDADLEALCIPCHKIADRERAQETQDRRWSLRLDAWATKCYGENWDDWISEEAAEAAFIAWLRKRGEW